MASSANNSSSNDAGASLAARRARLRGSLARANYAADPFAEAQSAESGAPAEHAESAPQGVDADPELQQPDPNDFFANAPGAVNVYGVPIDHEPQPAQDEYQAAEEALPEPPPPPAPPPRRVRGQRATAAPVPEPVIEAPVEALQPVEPEETPEVQPTFTSTAPYSDEPPPYVGARDHSHAQHEQHHEHAQHEPHHEHAQNEHHHEHAQHEQHHEHAQHEHELSEKPPASVEQHAAPASLQVEGLTAGDRKILSNIQKAVSEIPGSNQQAIELMAKIGHSVESIPNISERANHATEVLTNIDQSLNACATNLAALQNLASEQGEVLSSLTETLQNQTLTEIGLNLTSLTESLTAALEPMKAIGELIPALDQLITTLDGREGDKPQKLSPDDLVTSLSDQLAAGLIDPWTFKCAYMAVYPSDSPAELLHRLVELLGTQRLSGDLFRSAYEAVQAAESPLRPGGFTQPAGGDFTRGITDEAIKSQLEALQRSNDDMRHRQEEREKELSEMLAHKERELQNAQELLNQKLEELNSRYEDAAEILNNREEDYRAALESKDMELIEKESELNMLRAQMEELRLQTEDMVKDLSKKMSEEMQQFREERERERSNPDLQSDAGSAAAAAVNQSFFDPAPRGPQGGGLFDTAPQAQKNLFSADPGPALQTDSGSFSEGMLNPQPQLQQPQLQQPQQFQPQQAQPSYPQQNAGFGSAQPALQGQPQQTFQPQQQQGYAQPAVATQPAPPQPALPQPKPAPSSSPPTTPFSGGASGSYGSGVRAQVFEVIVRQALAGAPWREICAGPMQVNNISPEEVEGEVRRRQSMLGK